MEKSPSIANLAKALKAFHKEVNNIPKDATNPFFNSRYATLSKILDVIKPALLSNDLSFTQFPSGQNGLVTILMHCESGEFMQCEYFMQPLKNDPQAQGSVISYMRRYSLASVLGLNLEDDHKAPYPMTDEQTAPRTSSNNEAKEWLDLNSTAFNDAVEALKAGTTTFKDLYEQFKISKNVKAELQAALEAAPPAGSVKDDKPWLDKGSKKYDLVVERLKNKSTTLAEVRKFFKLNKEIAAELQAIVNDTNTQK